MFPEGPEVKYKTCIGNQARRTGKETVTTNENCQGRKTHMLGWKDQNKAVVKTDNTTWKAESKDISREGDT